MMLSFEHLHSCATECEIEIKVTTLARLRGRIMYVVSKIDSLIDS